MAKKQKSYQQLRQELDTILADLEQVSDDIDQAIAQYEKGQVIIGEIEKYLQKTKAKIEVLKPKK